MLEIREPAFGFEPKTSSLRCGGMTSPVRSGHERRLRACSCGSLKVSGRYRGVRGLTYPFRTTAHRETTVDDRSRATAARPAPKTAAS